MKRCLAGFARASSRCKRFCEVRSCLRYPPFPYPKIPFPFTVWKHQPFPSNLVSYKHYIQYKRFCIWRCLEVLSAFPATPAGARSDAIFQLSCLWHNHQLDTLMSADSEGRCVITDHGAFVLFNMYIPAVCSGNERGEERAAFKELYLSVSRNLVMRP